MLDNEFGGMAAISATSSIVIEDKKAKDKHLVRERSDSNFEEYRLSFFLDWGTWRLAYA